jgi:hypothetical protein
METLLSSRDVSYLMHKYPLHIRVRLEIRHLGVTDPTCSGPCRQLNATAFEVAFAHGSARARGVRYREVDRASV